MAPRNELLDLLLKSKAKYRTFAIALGSLITLAAWRPGPLQDLLLLNAHQYCKPLGHLPQAQSAYQAAITSMNKDDSSMGEANALHECSAHGD